jgi:hypothetical protein
MRSFGLNFCPTAWPFKVLIRALLLASVCSIASVAMYAEEETHPVYYCASADEVLLWPATTWNGYSVVRLSDKKLHKPTLAVAERQTLDEQLSQIDNCGQTKSAQWVPAVQLYSVEDGGQSHLGIIVKNHYEEVDFDSPSSPDALDVVHGALGNGNSELLLNSESALRPDLREQLAKLKTNFPRAVVFVADGNLRWILEERISQTEWTLKTQGRSHGLKSVAETTVPVQPKPQVSTENSPPSEKDNRELAFWFVLVVIVSIAAGWGLPKVYRLFKKKSNASPVLRSSNRGPTNSSGDDSLIRTVEILVDELTDAAAKTISVEPEAELHRPIIEWAALKYKRQLRLMSVGNEPFWKFADSVQQRIARELFDAKDLHEVGNLWKLGSESSETFLEIGRSVFATDELLRFQGSKKTSPDRIRELPQLLKRLDDALAKTRTEHATLSEWATKSRNEIEQSADRRKTIEERGKQIDNLQRELNEARRDTADWKLKCERADKDMKKLGDIVRRAGDLEPLAKALAAGKRSVLSRIGKVQAAAALAFLIDYSMLNIALAIVSADRQREHVMRENLWRIAEKAKAKGIPGFNSELVGVGASQIDLLVHESDHHLDRPLFGDILKSLREFGDFHMHFDFDVDATGVYRVR